MTSAKNQECSVSQLRIFDGRGIFVCSTSPNKPDIPQEILAKWQKLIDLAAESLGQPHALLTMLDEKDLHVLLHNTNADDTFIRFNRFPLGLGVYCETTMSLPDVNYVSNALADANWDKNPSIDFSLISYIGLATRWPDGEIFGTICGLGDSPLKDDGSIFESINFFRSVVESDLQLLFLEQKRAEEQTLYKNSVREIHHRIKNHLNMICGLMQLEQSPDIRSKDDFILFQNKIYARIKAVAELHTMLAYKGQQCNSLGEHLSKIMDVWIQNNPQGNASIKVNTTFDDISLDDDKIMYFGILFNELITNSFRHALPGHPEPRINLALTDLGNAFRLEYSDNGPGFPDDFDIGAVTSLGLSLVSELAVHLNGNVRAFNGPGATFVFHFAKPKKECTPSEGDKVR